MSGSSLRLRFFADGDGTGKLVARAESKGFAGEGGAYFDARALEQFAMSLRAYPLTDRLSVAGGYYSKAPPHELEQEHLSIAFYAANARGHIGVHVRLATPLWQPARAESQLSVSLEILTTYEPLGRFSKALVALVNEEVEEAVLENDDGEPY